MKILVLSNLYPPDIIGGYELGCQQVVDALRARGHDVRVLTIRPADARPPRAATSAATLQLIDVWNALHVRAQQHRSPPTCSQAESHRSSTPSTSTR